MNRGSDAPVFRVCSVGGLSLVLAALVISGAPASAQVVLNLGDILVAEPGESRISRIDPVTGAKTVIAEGGLLSPANKAVGVAFAPDGDVIVAHRSHGLIRVNPVNGTQSVLSEGGHFVDPWAIAIDRNTGAIYVADSGYDNDRPEINEAGKIIRVDPVSGAQEVIAAGSPCVLFPEGAACQNTTSAGSYLSHPYGIAIDYVLQPGTLIVADMGAFNGQGAIIRLQPVPGGTQTLLWGPASAVPAPAVSQVAPLGCPMGVAVEPNGNILTTAFTFPPPPAPAFPPPAGTYYGCAPPGIFRIDLFTNSQSVVNANAPAWEPGRSYLAGDVVRGGQDFVHRATVGGVSGSLQPDWSSTSGGATLDGSVVWQNIGAGADWLIPFGVEAEPAASPAGYNILVGDEGHSALFRLDANGALPPSGTLATGTSFVTSVNVITFMPPGGFKVEPIRSNGQPSGMLSPGTTSVALSLTTNTNATCRYDSSAGIAYGSMASTFATTGSTAHSTPIEGLTGGTSHTFFVRCMDSSGNANTTDFSIAFTIPLPPSIEPVAAYHFDEGLGTVLTDVSGHGNDGVISGATWHPEGRAGGALSFDGTDDWVTVASAPALDLMTGMTLQAWVYPTAGGGGSWRNVLIKERANGEVYNLYANNGADAPATYVVTAEQPGTVVDAIGSSALPLHTWSHLAVTYDGSTLKLYVNGTQVGSHAAAGTLLTSAGDLRIGGNGVWGEFFEGRIDEVRIHNRALSEAEILAGMNTPVNESLPDTIPPFRLDGQPAGVLPWSTTQAMLRLSTVEPAVCRYSLQSGTPYASMANIFTTTGSLEHSTTVTGLTIGAHAFYVRCADTNGNVNTDDFVIAFSVTTASAVMSGFTGTENPLSENGAWTASGSWAALHKDNGAYATGLNGHARLAAPNVGADQYAEIVYSQDPGASSWVGVTTRMASTGSGYLAIAYAGEVRLYRVDDSGTLNFTMLASAPAGDLDEAPRRLRLESQGNTHRVYLNGVEKIGHTATGIVYSSGQPGIAASTWGGPQVRILYFAGGDIGATPPDVVSPLRFDGLPAGSIPANTNQVNLSLVTHEPASCRYDSQAGVPYLAMAHSFGATGGTAHTTLVTGLSNGQSYSYYVRCADAGGNVNADDFVIQFSVADVTGATSTFTGSEDPLSEGGVWEAPGAWASLRKDAGAYAAGMNGMARLAAPLLGPNQYAEIVYSGDPGASGWVGVTTRIQGGSDGGGYLAIVYAGEARLYRVDDGGALEFALLAASAIDAGAAPRRLRLESEGNVHRVYFNGAEVISHTASGPVYSAGQPGVAASTWGGPVVKVLFFEAGDLGAGSVDATPPFRFDGQPAGTLPWGTTQQTLALTTHESAVCRYDTQAGVAYGSMAHSFATTGSIGHETTVAGLGGGASYTFYIRCADALGNVNTDDYVIAFSVADVLTVTSSFTGGESPLSEGGAWDSPGAWADFNKSDGAYAPGLNALARLVSPLIGADQYAEITYDQDPGSSSWVGVSTRLQGPENGSGYLAIVYAGEVQLYRADDVGGSLVFTLLASAAVEPGAAPRRLRLESEGNQHRVSFNGVQIIDHTASGLVYSGGQPGIAASTWGGPQLKILSFEASDIAD